VLAMMSEVYELFLFGFRLMIVRKNSKRRSYSTDFEKPRGKKWQVISGGYNDGNVEI